MAAKQQRHVTFLVEKPIEFARKKVSGAVPALASAMQRDLRAVIDTPYPPASRPGKPPHKRTGYLQSHAVVKGTPVAPGGFARIVIRAPEYGMFYLEQGTKRMAPRPWIKPTIFDKATKWTREFARILRSMTR